MMFSDLSQVFIVVYSLILSFFFHRFSLFGVQIVRTAFLILLSERPQKCVLVNAAEGRIQSKKVRRTKNCWCSWLDSSRWLRLHTQPIRTESGVSEASRQLQAIVRKLNNHRFATTSIRDHQFATNFNFVGTINFPIFGFFMIRGFSLLPKVVIHSFR